MAEVLKDLSAPAITSAIETSVQAEWVSLGRGAPDGEVHESPEATRVVTGIPHPLCNNVTKFQFGPGEADTQIEATLAYFSSRKAPMSWWLGPSARPADLGKRLEAHGVTHRVDMPGMAVDLEAVNEHLATPSGLTIEHVEGNRMLERWVHIVAIGFGLPESTEERVFGMFAGAGFGQDQPWRHYLALLNGEPVAISSLFLGAGVAGIYIVGTVPEARR